MPIAAAVDILFVVTIAHQGVIWWSIPTLLGRVLGIVGLFVTLNDWLTTRSSFALYSARAFALDLAVIFILNGIPQSVSNPNGSFGLFWLLLALCEVCYIGWDLLIGALAGPKLSNFWSGWTWASLIAALTYGGVAWAWLAVDWRVVPVGLSLVAATYCLVLLVIWNLQRYRVKRSQQQPFLDE